MGHRCGVRAKRGTPADFGAKTLLPRSHPETHKGTSWPNALQSVTVQDIWRASPPRCGPRSLDVRRRRQRRCLPVVPLVRDRGRRSVLGVPSVPSAARKTWIESGREPARPGRRCQNRHIIGATVSQAKLGKRVSTRRCVSDYGRHTVCSGKCPARLLLVARPSLHSSGH